MLNQDLLNRLNERVLETYLLAERIWNQNFELPKIEFKNLGRVAGRAFYKENKIIYSPVLFSENVDWFLNRTVPHEIAHLITKILFPNAKQHHGPEWRLVMQKLGIEDNTRCHSYDTSSVSRKRNKKQFIYSCACPDRAFRFSPRKHHNQINHNCYSCLVCKQKCKFTGKTISFV